MSLKREFKCDLGIVDDDGLGGGVTDPLRASGINIIAFRGGMPAKDDETYFNCRAEGYFKLQGMIQKGYLKLLNDPKLIDELMTIKFKFNNKGQRQIVSKDDMRKEGLKSPDMADSLMMAVSICDKPVKRQMFMPEEVHAY